tara:strand:- start:2 stop:403 length:402 start_codon:yes stop_codon:yes gene_type:complete
VLETVRDVHGTFSGESVPDEKKKHASARGQTRVRVSLIEFFNHFEVGGDDYRVRARHAALADRLEHEMTLILGRAAYFTQQRYGHFEHLNAVGRIIVDRAVLRGKSRRNVTNESAEERVRRSQVSVVVTSDAR